MNYDIREWMTTGLVMILQTRSQSESFLHTQTFESSHIFNFFTGHDAM